MNKPEHQRWPDGTKVRFTDEARESMQKRLGITKPLAIPGNGPDVVYTIDNTNDCLHDVVLRETGERYGTYWLAMAETNRDLNLRPKRRSRHYCSNVQDDAYGVSMSCFLSDGHKGSCAWTRNKALSQGHPRREPDEQLRLEHLQDGPQTVPSEYRVLPTGYSGSTGASPEDKDLFELRVCWRGADPETGTDSWAVVNRRGSCLAADGTWSSGREPRPSARDDTWLARYRFDRETALRLAAEAVDAITFNGLTLAQWNKQSVQPAAFHKGAE